jgi:hypothetical protein
LCFSPQLVGFGLGIPRHTSCTATNRPRSHTLLMRITTCNQLFHSNRQTIVGRYVISMV